MTNDFLCVPCESRPREPHGGPNIGPIFWIYMALCSAGSATLSAQEANSDSEQAVGQPREDKAEQPEAGVVRGVLVNTQTGAPVAEATVILRGTRAQRTVSDADGRFRFDGVTPTPYQFTIWAHTGNLVAEKKVLSPTVSADGKSVVFQPLRLEMSEGRQVKFLVTSAVSGKPLPGAIVRFGYPERRQTTTAAIGTALVEGLPRERYEVEVEAPAHARQTLELDLSQAKRLTKLRIPLAAGGVVRGVALDPDGKPVPDALVYYHVRANYGEFGDAQRTDAEGRFQNSFLPLDHPLKISVAHDNFLREEQEIVVSPENRQIKLTLTLHQRPPPKSVRGVVKDEKGNRLPQTRIINVGKTSTQREFITDSQGAFAIDDLEEGYAGYQIYVRAEGFAPTKLVLEPGTVDAPALIEITLKRGHSLRGRVVDENGKAMPDAMVTPRSPNYSFTRLGESCHTGKDGQFAFEGLPDDVRFDVWAKGYPHLLSQALELDRPEPVTVQLAAPGVLRGHVVDKATGQPVRQFRVQLIEGGGVDGTWYDPGVTFNSAEGEFTIRPLPNGTPFGFIVLADNYERAVVRSAVSARAEEAKETLVSLEPVDLGQRYSLQVRLVDQEGKPARAVQLRLIVSAQPPMGEGDNRFNWTLIDNGQLARKPYCDQFLSGVTDGDGCFEFENLLPGKHLQLAYWGQGVPRSRSLAFEQTQPGASGSAVITTPQPACLRGTIDRDRLANADSVRLSPTKRPYPSYDRKLESDQQTFRFDDLPAGEYWVSVCTKPVEFTKDGHTFSRIPPLASQKIRLQPGETKDVSFVEPDPDGRR